MTFHLCIKGRVQGVGFRPYVLKHALKKGIPGYVSNEVDGVHVVFNHSSEKEARMFVDELIKDAPSKAIIRSSSFDRVPVESFKDFSIRLNNSNERPDILISPDFAICPECKKEFHDPSNRRYGYAFITCTVCGPRYSIMKELPYERHLTSMECFIQCPQCKKEYENVDDRRYFSQINSCTECGVQLSWHTKFQKKVLKEQDKILPELLSALDQNKIVAVKGIGGFLLLCDAASQQAINTLRERKHRPKKPFAVLFPSVETVKQYSHATATAIYVLMDEVSPIVVMQPTKECFDHLDMNGIAPGLNSIGVMLPYAPLLEWIASAWGKPLIATSGNLSGSSIVFQSEKKEELFQYADFILDHNREIIVPQDDSVVRIAEKNGNQIIIRRSRGFAPAIILSSPPGNEETIFAAGADMKSAFAFQHHPQIYLSQFLGDLGSYDAQQNYRYTFDHYRKLLNGTPQIVLSDLHPGYSSTQIAREYSEQFNAPHYKIQHHEAHFAAVLGEHNLFDSEEKTLGVIWDGTGMGSDGNIWGGEFFVYENGKMERAHYLETFTNIAGDRMAKEPALAALAIAKDIEAADEILHQKFSKRAWNFYHKVIAGNALENTSAGRYFDGVASLLGLADINSYEGEAALKLEQLGSDFYRKIGFEISHHYFHEEINCPAIPMKRVIAEVINDILSGKNKAEIAAAFHASLVIIIERVAFQLGVKNIAFSGGVFQNSLLVDLITTYTGKEFELHFHRQTPPNDECIALGQLMHFQNIKTLQHVFSNSRENSFY